MITETQINTDIHADLEQLKQMVTDSQLFLSLGFTDTLSQKIEMARTNPLQLLFDNLTNSEKSISLFWLQNFVISFFKKNKRMIKHIFRTDNSTTILHYTIILQKDNSKNRHKIIEFLRNYENLSFAHRFKIIFQFVPEIYVEKLNFVEKIDL
jgi:hypothetical protein